VDTSARSGTRARRTSPSRADYRITEADKIGKGGKKTKFKANLAAIKLLKQIESENRLATPEEQAVLVKYVGWGGMPEAFNQYDSDWEKEYKKLKEALADEEYKAAKASTPNAHYTSFEAIGGIWEGLAKLGLTGGRVNEPSLGVGHFFGLMPDKVATASTLHGVELDSLSGRIAQQLYQSAKIQIKGFEKTKYPDNYFDLFISNVPFGNYSVHDPEMRKFKGQIHDFFFIKALNKTRPGGLVVFITSKGTMDKADPRIRSLIASKADLIGAIRLPNTAFKENANTEVVTDIIVLQKRDPKGFQKGENFKERGVIKKAGEEFTVNEYFVRNPKNILGKLTHSGTMYRGGEMTVEPRRGVKLGEEITRIISEMKLTEPIDARQRAVNDERNSPDYSSPAPDHVKEGAYTLKEGRLMRNVQGTLVPGPRAPATAARIKKLVRVRDTLRDLIHKQLDEETTDKQVEAARKKLKTVYDRATNKGRQSLSDPYNQRIFHDDPDLPMLLALEKYDPETKKVVGLADIFTKRTQSPRKPIESAETADAALIASLNEKGRVDLDYMAQLLGEPIDKVVIELEGRIFFDPAETQWVPADQYLSGNVRRKLEEAEAAAEMDPSLKPNAKALEEVQPADISTLDIDVRLGASWVEEEDYLDFYKHINKGNTPGVSFRKSPLTGTWAVSGNPGSSTQLNVVWGTQDVGALRLMELSMNQKQPKVTRYAGAGKPPVVDPDATAAASAKQQALKDEFKRWLWEDVKRADRLSRTYNDRFNNVVFPVWDGSHLTLPGKVDTVKMRPYQLNAVWRFLSQGNTLFAHVVGAGKTYTGVAAAMEARRIGRAKKPIFVVPNHLVSQWRGAWMELYPSATILVAREADFKPKNRQTLMNKIATGDWDGIIVPMTSFEKIPMSPDVARAFFDEQLEALEREIQEANADKNKNLTKELEKAKKRLEASLQKQQAKWKKDQGPYFDEMGIDMMLVDEAQEYKNLFFRTQMTRVAGVSQQFVQKSFDMEMKTQYLNRVTGSKGLIFATGTPVTNSISEMFTLQRYLQPGILKEAGIQSFDFWAQAFGEVVSGVEVTPEGKGFRVHSRFAKFTNLPELMQMYRMVADIQTQKMIKLKVPDVKGGKARVMQAPQTEALKAFVDTLAARADDIRKGKVRPDEDNMLRVTGEGRKAALDLRLVGRAKELDPTGKVNMAIDKIFEIWERTAEDKATQVVWIDLSTPKPGQWSVYKEVKKGLVARGVPAGEVAFIHDVKDKKKLNAFYSKVNEGRVRVVIASTGKMGTGANIQQRLIAAHHLDAPWRPADVEQRDGRIIRQGNSYDEVEIYRYVTKGSFDAYMWQTLETKAKFIEQLMAGDTTAREIEDLSKTSLSFAEVKALSAGNPKIMEVVQLDADVKILQAVERQYRESQLSLRRQHAALPETIKGHKESLEAHRTDAEAYSKAREVAGDELDITIGGKKYAKREEAGEALNAYLDGQIKGSESFNDIGSAYGFQLTAKWFTVADRVYDRKLREYVAQNVEDRYRIMVVGEWDYSVDLEESPTGNISRILNTLKRFEQMANSRQAQLKKAQKEIVDVEKQIGKPFEKERELKDKIAKLAKLHSELQTEGTSGTGPAPQQPQVDSREHYYAYITDSKSFELVPNASAIEFEGFEQFDFFVRKRGPKDWVISEARTGMVVASNCRTKRRETPPKTSASQRHPRHDTQTLRPRPNRRNRSRRRSGLCRRSGPPRRQSPKAVADHRENSISRRGHRGVFQTNETLRLSQGIDAAQVD
jgi:N12 class adenine-specific DNA methylase